MKSEDSEEEDSLPEAEGIKEEGPSSSDEHCGDDVNGNETLKSELEVRTNNVIVGNRATVCYCNFIF